MNPQSKTPAGAGEHGAGVIRKDNARIVPPANLAARLSRLHKSPRQVRALAALLQAHQWISRAALAQTAGAANVCDVVLRLRGRYGHDAIDTHRTEMLDRDGVLTRPGFYLLTEIGRERIMAALGAGGAPCQM